MHTSIKWIVLVTIIGSHCACTPETIVNNRLSKIMEEYDYTLYTPFRSEDYPPHIFLMARNHLGKITEFTVARYDEVFEVDTSLLFEESLQGIPDELKSKLDLDSKVAGEFFGSILEPELMIKYTKSLTIRFVNPKTRQLISATRLADLRFDLRDSLKFVLRDYKDSGKLENVYLVLETLSVGGVEINLTIKDEFKATVGVKEIKDITKIDTTVTSKSDSSFTLKVNTPLVIGYKAMLFPETILRTQVSVSDVGSIAPIPAREMNKAKTP